MAQMGRRAKQRRNLDYLIGSVIVLGILAAVSWAFYYPTTRPKGIDPVTLCPADGPIGHFVLLVDKTDPLTFTQEQSFKVRLRELIEKKIPQGYLFSVFVLGEDFKQTAVPLAELCNPGSGLNKSELTQNPEKLTRQYQAKFLEPLMAQAGSMLSVTSAKTSPIFEMLQLVGINAFRKHDVKGPRRLIVMSDMLHNTAQFSMYRSFDYLTFAATDYGQKMRLQLPDVEVEIHYLMNTPQLQTKRNVDFWEAHFKKSGARIVEVQPLEG